MFWLRRIQNAIAVFFFNFPKFKFALGNLHNREGNSGKQKRRRMKEGSMHDEQMKPVLENNASAAIRITVRYLHFALVHIETKIR